MKTLKVPGMMCQMCVKRITKALTDEGIAAQVDLATKTVTVSSELAQKVISILDDIGFDAN